MNIINNIKDLKKRIKVISENVFTSTANDDFKIKIINEDELNQTLKKQYDLYKSIDYLNDNDYELKKGNIHGELIVRYNRDKHRLDINLMPQSIEKIIYNDQVFELHDGKIEIKNHSEVIDLSSFPFKLTSVEANFPLNKLF